MKTHTKLDVPGVGELALPVGLFMYVLGRITCVSTLEGLLEADLSKVTTSG
jgi:hypothetical protein